MLSKVRSEGETRMSEEKRISDRKRNIIVLAMRYLVNIGYIETATKLESESHIGLDQWDAADNIDLYSIVMEFEQYYEHKFGKVPKLVRKSQENNKKQYSLPKIAQSPQQSKSSTSILSQTTQLSSNNSSTSTQSSQSGSNSTRQSISGLPPKNTTPISSTQKKSKSTNSSVDEKQAANADLSLNIEGLSAQVSIQIQEIYSH